MMLYPKSDSMFSDGHSNQRLGRRNFWLLIMAMTLATMAVSAYRIVITSFESSTSKSNQHFPASSMESSRRQLLEAEEEAGPRKLRVLYTITTLAEYDTGTRATTKGDDRMQRVLIPVMKQTVYSLLEQGYHVDVFIVAHFQMTREYLIRQALPPEVGLSVWDDASPISYDPGKRYDPNGKLRTNTLGLARQHRFVVRQHLMDYDFFMCFEDDMILKGAHVANHIVMTQELFQLREHAPDEVDMITTQEPKGTLSKSQLQRLLPGIMRVEVLLDEKTYGAQRHPEPVPIHPHPPLEAETCCHLINVTVNPNRPAAPTSDKVFVWETGIRALGVRYLPQIGHVVFQRGPSRRDEHRNLTIADYWAGKDGYFGKDRRPQPGDFAYINNQGGWMGTRQQIWEWNTEICPGGFLPPFDSPHYNHDGLDPRNVEWWSGGMGLFTSRHACNMQRIISLDLDRFPKHLIYHSANNKQRQLQYQANRFVKINDLYGQLLTTQKNYEKNVQFIWDKVD